VGYYTSRRKCLPNPRPFSTNKHLKWEDFCLWREATALTAQRKKYEADRAKIGNTQQHNEREKDSYVNQDIVPERTSLNCPFQGPIRRVSGDVLQMEADGVISTVD
jgi:hypothetical protein